MIEHAGSFLVEDIQKVTVIFRDGAEVDGCIGECRVGLCSHLREGKLEDFSAIHPADAVNVAALTRAIFSALSFGVTSQGSEISVAREVEVCKGRDISDELSACRVVSNEILPNTQSINGL